MATQGYLLLSLPLLMIRCTVFLFALSLCYSGFLSGQTIPVFTGQPIPAPENESLNKTFKSYQVFEIASTALNAYLQEESNGQKRFDLQLPGVGTWPLALVSSGLIPESYRLRVDDGKKVTELPGPGDIAWKGNVVGSSQSDVRLTVTDHFIFGSIHNGGDIWFIEPLNDLLPGGAVDHYIVYRVSDVLPNPDLTCGVTQVAQQKEKQQGQTQKPENQVGQCKNAEIAIASAYDMFQRYGSTAGVQTHNIGVMNEVANDYDSDFDDDIYFLIATQYVSTTTTSSLDAALTATTDVQILLTNFTTWGGAGNFGVTFDLGQLWTARNVCFNSNCSTIGLAWVGTVCGTSKYHVLEDWTGTNNSGSGYELRVMTSHEIGHNFSCNHSTAGTIMGPSLTNTTIWSATSIGEMNTFLASISCLALCGVNFESAAITASESVSSIYLSPGDPSCEMGYTEVSIPVVYSGTTAGGSVDISVTGGTATENLDFDIPSNTITFPPGGTGQTGNFIIRVWNDAHFESNETILLQLSGALAGSQNTATITLVSDDLDPATSYYRFGQVGAGNTGIFVPFAGASQDARTQIVFSVAELTTAGFAAGDIINGLAIEVATKSSTQPFNGFTIKMKHTTAAPNSNSQPETSGFTTVYNSNHTTFVGWNKFNFDQGFSWNGSSNLKIEFCYDNSSASGNDIVRSNSTPTAVFVNANSGSGCSLPVSSWSWFTARPNTRLYKGNEIAITLNDEADTNLKNGQTAYFKDAQNEFIVAIKQNSGADIGCINVKIDRAGNGRQTPAWLPGFFVSDKTFLITAANPTATYDLTLYFSKAEMAVWGTGTSSLNILKSSTPISSSSAATSTINTSITRATFGPAATPDAYYSYKGTFTNFSGFAVTNATSVPAPVEWLDFTGKLVGKNVDLTWTTAAELNNRGFDVERSVNGVSFEKIGFVQGRGTITIPQPYHFTDGKATQIQASVLYYRLRQIDDDGTHSFSNTVPVIMPGAHPTYLLYPNPAREEATLQLQDCDDCTATFVLTDASGRVVLRTENLAITSTLNLSGLSAGVYLAEISTEDGKRWQTKLVKL